MRVGGLAGRAAAALLAAALAVPTAAAAQGEDPGDGERPRAREAGLVIGGLDPGPLNAITDVDGVRVGHRTLRRGDSLRTGVTAILPHGGNLFRRKVPAAVAVGNGFGKLVGSTQVNELGELETPILLTGTLSVFRAADALVDTMLAMPGNRDVRSINPVVGETNDGWLSDVRSRPIEPRHVRAALRAADGGAVEEGSVGAGTGTRALGWKGGIGTASRRVSVDGRTWTVGVLAQTNYGGRLRVAGIPVWRALGRTGYHASPPDGGSGPEAGGDQGAGAAGPSGGPADHDRRGGGSVMIVVATDAPLAHRALQRLAERTFLGIARTGSWSSHGSGDYAVAFSTRPHGDPPERVRDGSTLSSLFRAAVEATEEAALNSLFRATTVTGRDGHTAEALPLDRVLEVLERRATPAPTGAEDAP